MIYPFTFDVPSGSIQTIEPPQFKYYSCLDGTRSSITIRILDQAGKPAKLIDPASSFTIEIKPRKKKD